MEAWQYTGLVPGVRFPAVQDNAEIPLLSEGQSKMHQDMQRVVMLISPSAAAPIEKKFLYTVLEESNLAESLSTSTL